MAFALVQNCGIANSTTANQSSLACTTLFAIEAGNLCVAIIAVDNNQTTDGDEGAVSSVTDASSNTWTKGAEFTNGQGTAQTGATCSIWFCNVVTQINVSTSVTANFTNNTSRDAAAMSLVEFTMSAGTAAVEGTPGTLANDGADPGSLNVTTSNIECLRIRGIAGESNSLLNLTVTAGWTAAGPSTANSGVAATSMAVRGEYRIATGTSFASDPTWTAADCASVYVALKETGGTAGWGALLSHQFSRLVNA